MTRIAVSENALVDYGENRWRLIQLDEDATPTLLVEVRAGKNFRYDEYFATTRALPPLGEVAAHDIGQVVLGWSDEEAAWQLGMTLSPDLSFTRSSRWFEVLRFANLDAEQAARQVGQALADMLGRPFVASSPEMADEPESMSLVDLPLDLGTWQVHGQRQSDEAKTKGRALRLIRTPSWLNAKVRGIAWYGVLAAVYAWVSLSTLGSDLALPNAGTLIPDPSLLPYLGLVVFILLLLQIIRQLWHIQHEPDTLLIDAADQSISALRGDHTLWQVGADRVQSVYASELVKKRGKRSIIFHGEINLHLVDGKFRRVLMEIDKRSDSLLPGIDVQKDKQRPAGVSILPADSVATALQAAALHIAIALGDLPVWYDRRFK